MTPYAIAHIAGSAFALTLSADTSPISIAEEPDLDIGDWGAELVLVGNNTRVTIPGVWVSSIAPCWTLSFIQDNTTAWVEGAHDVRLALTSPEVLSRRFEQKINLVLGVSR